MKTIHELTQELIKNKEIIEISKEILTLRKKLEISLFEGPSFSLTCYDMWKLFESKIAIEKEY